MDTVFSDRWGGRREFWNVVHGDEQEKAFLLRLILSFYVWQRLLNWNYWFPFLLFVTTRHYSLSITIIINIHFYTEKDSTFIPERLLARCFTAAPNLIFLETVHAHYRTSIVLQTIPKVVFNRFLVVENLIYPRRVLRLPRPRHPSPYQQSLNNSILKYGYPCIDLNNNKK